MKAKTNRVYSRYRFLGRTQKEGDIFKNFLTDLRLIVKECGYQDQDDMIRDAIVYGIQEHKVREKCIGEGSNLTLEKAINFARTCYISISSKYSLWRTNRYKESRKVGPPLAGSQHRLKVKMKVRNR